MESKTKELVKSGHELVVLLGTQHGMHDAASLVQRLTAQLDITAIVLREMTKKRDAEHGDVLTWEKTMFKVCGEDGPKSVADKFASLEAERDALAAENAELKSFCKSAAFDADYEAELSMDRGGFTDALNNLKNPATDAFLREQMAKGVEAFAKASSDKASSCSLKVHAGYWTHAKESAQDFAAKLRAGEAV